MTTIIFKNFIDYLYNSELSEKAGPLWVLGEFLTSDVGTNLSFADEWLNNPNISEAAFDFSEFDIRGNNIILGCSFLDDFPRLTLPRQTLIDIAKEWASISRTKVSYIILTLHDDGSFEFSTSQTKPES